MPSGRPALPEPSPPPPPGSAGILDERRFLISEALGPAGSRDWVDVDLLSVEAGEVETETFFFAVLTLT